MTQVKVFNASGAKDVEELNDFLKGVMVIDIIVLGEQISAGGWPIPEVMVVYDI